MIDLDTPLTFLYTPDELRLRCAEANLQGRLDERERCAKIAEGFYGREFMNDRTAEAIAEAIRKGE